MLKTCLFISLHAASVLGILVAPLEENYIPAVQEEAYTEASDPTLAELVAPEVIEALTLKQEELPSFSENDLGEIIDFLDRHKEERLANTHPKDLEEQLELFHALFTEENLNATKSQEELDLLKEEVFPNLLTSDNSQTPELLSSPAGQLFSYWLYEAFVGDESSYYESYHYPVAQNEVARPSRLVTAQPEKQAETAWLPPVTAQPKEQVETAWLPLQLQAKTPGLPLNEGLSPERIIGEKEYFGPNKVKITWVNGIANDFEDSAASAQMLSDIFHKAKVHFFYNPTEGITRDLFRARSHYNGEDCPEARDLAEHLRLILKTTDRIVHIGHSHGGIITARAAEYLKPEERARIDVILVGSPALIPEGVFRSTIHYVSDLDPIPSWNPEIYQIVRGLKSNKSVVVLPGNAIFYNYGFDHYIESPTHVKALKEYAEAYLAHEKPPEPKDNWWQRVWWWMFG